MLWAGVGRLKAPATTDGMNEYERALAEEMEDPLEQVAATFEGSRRLGQDFACAIPTTIVRLSFQTLEIELTPWGVERRPGGFEYVIEWR